MRVCVFGYGRAGHIKKTHITAGVCLPALRLGTAPSLAGDVIVSLDGRPVRNLFDLTSILDEASVGDEVEVVALRGVDQSGEPQRVAVRAKLQAEAA